MCCSNNTVFAKELYHRIKKGKVIFYKVYEKNPYMPKILISPSMKHQIKSFGIVESGAKNNIRYRKYNEEINRGIHVFVTEEGAKNYRRFGEIIIKVRIKAKDLLGAEKTKDYNPKYGDNAVFTKVEITEKEWNKAFKE